MVGKLQFKGGIYLPKQYKDFMGEISKDELYCGLLAHGLFSEKLPPVFTSEFFGLPPIVVPKRELVNADYRHENLCYCLAVS